MRKKKPVKQTAVSKSVKLTYSITFARRRNISPRKSTKKLLAEKKKSQTTAQSG